MLVLVDEDPVEVLEQEYCLTMTAGVQVQVQTGVDPVEVLLTQDRAQTRVVTATREHHPLMTALARVQVREDEDQVEVLLTV